MRKVMLSVAFLITTIVVNANAAILYEEDCMEVAIDCLEDYEEIFGTTGPSQEAEVLNNFYAICEVGYDAFMDEQD